MTQSGKNSEDIPEELIQARAYKIWKARERKRKEGSPKDDWDKAKEYLERRRWAVILWNLKKLLTRPWQFLVKEIRSFWELFSESSSRDFALKVIQTATGAIGTIATILGGVVLFLNFLQGENRLITDRFSQSSQLLNNQEITSRIGGIYALEQIAKDSPNNFNLPILEMLASFVRTKAPLERQYINLAPPVNADVQAALTVIGRLDYKRQTRLNLKYCNLIEADLRNANLIGIDFYDSILARANLFRANLFRADLWKTSLWRANLEEANLKEAILEEANLEGANLRRAKGLTIEQVKSAQNWEKAIYDDNFRKKLGLPPESQASPSP